MNRRITWFSLYIYSIQIGIKYLFTFFSHRIFLKEGIKRLLAPMDLARYFEIPHTLRELQIKPGDLILDVSSPKLAALFLAKKFNCTIRAVDIYKAEISTWIKLTDILKKGDEDQFDNLVLEVEDAKKMSFSDNTFDKIYSISAIEHISPEVDGDTVAIKEIARILKSGGKLVITVPFTNNHETLYQNKNAYSDEDFKMHEKYLWARRYSIESLILRLVEPSGLRLLQTYVCYESFPSVTKMYARFLPFSVVFGLLFPIFYFISFRKTKKVSGIKTPANVLAILEKI